LGQDKGHDVSFHLYYLGAEQAAWRSLLRDMGVENVGLSYYAVRKRLPKKKAYSMDWGFSSVFLDSGGFTANKDAGKLTQGEWREYGRGYADFAQEHIHEIDIVSEFDCLALGQGYIEAMRRDVWDHIDPDQFLPVWHPEQGATALEALAERYKRVGIAQANIAMPGLNITPHLNKLANSGVKLHGLAMSRPDAIRHVRFSSASSTSWLSPMRFGETIIWDGARLVRYPMKMKDQARMRHRNDFERAGFDVAKINDDDPREVVRVSVWSWLQYEASMNGERVTRRGAQEVGQALEGPGAAVAQLSEGARKEPVALRMRDAAEMRTLPVFGFTHEEAIDSGSNQMVRTSLPVVSSTPQRVCNTCFVRAECPAFKEDTSCSYDLPIEVRTASQRKALMNGMVEMQAQRLAFMRFREELSGGYADPNTSQEFDRLLKTFQVQAELEDDREFFRMSVEAKGKSGVLSRLFGEKAADLANPIATQLGPQDTDRVLGRVIQGKAE
jgi:hypothetical protein